MQEYIRQHCIDIMNTLNERPSAHMFKEPVDPIRDEAPGYFDLIKRPMDLGTILSKLQNKKYMNVHQWKEDVFITFSNAITYNGKESPVGLIAVELNNYFKILSRSIVDDGRATWFNETIQLRKDLCDHTTLINANIFDIEHPSIGSVTYTDSPYVRKLLVLSLSEKEVQKLTKALEAIEDPNVLLKIDTIIRKFNPDVANDENIDINTLTPETLQHLYSLMFKKTTD